MGVISKQVPAGASGYILRFVAINSSTGNAFTTLAFNSSSLLVTYCRKGSAPVVISPVTATPLAYTASGLVLVDATNAPGLMELGLPDAAIAAGVDEVHVFVKGVTNLQDTVIRLDLAGSSVPVKNNPSNQQL
jgi:hypothetical protein